MKNAMVLFFKPITDFLGDGTETPKVKADSKWTKFIARVKRITALGMLKPLEWLSKLFRPLYIVYVAYEAIAGAIEADEKLLTDAEKFDFLNVKKFAPKNLSKSSPQKIQTRV